ncbi:hypothetical protein CBR_g12053 [Chara braunii]|uniref:Alpha-1,4 glucan phosphorylase n=1 Tax=Chara braunii TaxID=69332 RepID=A0A388KR47_CHABU|nr:hypothetical protein CBR_g12053 [Chara braunii]|eukprot:GBG72478.1 hypothetical protein CBR_g12053 [Chara braunii]
MASAIGSASAAVIISGAGAGAQSLSALDGSRARATGGSSSKAAAESAVTGCQRAGGVLPHPLPRHRLSATRRSPVDALANQRLAFVRGSSSKSCAVGGSDVIAVGSGSQVGMSPPNHQSSSSSFDVVQCIASEPASSVVSESDLPSIPVVPAMDEVAVASNIKYHADLTPCFAPAKFELPQAYRATAESVRDTLVRRWNDTYAHFLKVDPKHTYYLSMEYLQGRALLNAVGNLGLSDTYGAALQRLGYEMEDVASEEPDAALGNGGLGRLASCFLDSSATENYPVWGYGLRYKHGLFHQVITEEGQKEYAEKWLEKGNPWEIVRYDISYPVQFFGKVKEDENGKKTWVGDEYVNACAYDVPIPGYNTKNCINLRLWSTTVPADTLDLAAFNAGEHDKAARPLFNAEKICSVLYPGDGSREGKVLRLKQQYTLCSASLQDIVARFKARAGPGKPVNWLEFPEKVAVQMNDTHPTLSVPELLRILIDEEGLDWDTAWKITQGTCAYTNHTVLPEALEKWPYDLFKELLPRHAQIIETIDESFVESVIAASTSEEREELVERIARMRILENMEITQLAEEEEEDSESEDEGEEEYSSEEKKKKEKEKEMKAAEKEEKVKMSKEEKKAAKAAKKEAKARKAEEKKKKVPAPVMVRMANLCVIAGHTVNGVAEIHSDIVKDEVFNDFYKMWPDKFQNKTNGVTPRRWIRFCNPELSEVITRWLGTEQWVDDLSLLSGLAKFADDKKLHAEWEVAKTARKVKLAAYIKKITGIAVNPNVMFDIQVKRIHEYKRQLMNILGIIYRYKKIKEMTPQERQNVVPRVCIFGGKAFATYEQAKRIVKLVVDVGRVVNADPEIGDLLKVVFVPNYSVSVAEMLIPASELSQHISTAGMEASGTSNMKFSMNGCVLIGTLDGANVEIREHVGEENFFLFGARAEDVPRLRRERAEGKFVPHPRFEEVKAYIRSGVFGGDYEPLLWSLEGNEGYGRGDYFLVGVDFPEYLEAQERVDQAYKDKEGWVKMSILNTAGSGFFSSDRTIQQYANEIWNIKPCPVP